MPKIAYLCTRRNAISYEDHCQYHRFCQHLHCGGYGVPHHSSEPCEMASSYVSPDLGAGAHNGNLMPHSRCRPDSFLPLSLLVFLAVLILSLIEFNHSLLEVGRCVYFKAVHGILYRLSHFTVRPSVKIFTEILEKAVHASRADGSKSSFTCNCLLLHEAFNISLPFASSTQAT